jgi:hypothetical protein
MTPALFGFAAAVLRAWTRVYTWRLDPLLRERRCAEIESDLWECQQDPVGNRGVGPAFQLLARMVIGVPDDLGWRADYLVVEDNPQRRVVALTATMAAIVVAALWVFASTQPVALPRPPASPTRGWGPAVSTYLPPPPPPPPPPCQPPSLMVGCP